MGIKGKFLSIIVISIISLQALMSFQIFKLNSASKDISHQALRVHGSVVTVNKIAILQKSQVQIWKDLLVRGQDPESFKKYNDKLGEISNQIEKNIEDLKKQIDPMQIPFADNFLNLHKELNKDYFAARDQFLVGKEFKYTEADRAVKGKDAPVMESLTALSDLVEVNMGQQVEDSLSSAYSQSMYLFWFGLAFSGILIFLGFVISQKLSKQLSVLTEAVGDSGKEVSSASEQLSSSSAKLSESAQSQASSVEETSAALTEISGMIDSNSKDAVAVNQSTQEVYQISEKTRESMSHLSGAMDSILDSNKKIEDLVLIIEEIGAKTQLIDDIVFKTQLLSFNASVEAERAGEHGRGFSVVAQEVANLAQTSGKAAQEITDIVGRAVHEAETVSKENKERVSAGSQLANETKIQMENVLGKLSEIQASIDKIVSASREQGQGIGQISNSVNILNRATQDNASISEESAAASTELDNQSHALLSLVEELRGVVTGKKIRNQHQNQEATKAASSVNQIYGVGKADEQKLSA